MQVQIANGSSSENIFVELTEPSTKSPNSGESIPANNSIKLRVDSGTSKLFVLDSNKSLIWEGIVPTNVKNPIMISPENRIVEYDGEPLPNTLNTKENFSFMKPGNGLSLLWILVIILLIVFGGWLLLRKKR